MWHAVKQYSRQVVILKLALIFDGLAPVSATGLAANWNRFNFLLGHVSVQTTEKYVGCKLRLREAVNDQIGIEPSQQGLVGRCPVSRTTQDLGSQKSRFVCPGKKSVRCASQASKSGGVLCESTFCELWRLCWCVWRQFPAGRRIR